MLGGLEILVTQAGTASVWRDKEPVPSKGYFCVHLFLFFFDMHWAAGMHLLCVSCGLQYVGTVYPVYAIAACGSWCLAPVDRP